MQVPGATRRNTLLSALALAVAMPLAAAQDLMVYPKQGQSPDQQSKDRYECHTWAVQQSGFDPSNPQAANSGKSGTGKEVLRGGARGAAAGAAIGAIAGDAGKGAAIGATAGGLRRGFKERDRQQAESSSASPAQQAYQRAIAACLDGRGYSVK